MTDAALIFNPDTSKADLSLDAFDLQGDAGLKTAVILSLFTDASAHADDVLPAGITDRRGFWADAYSAGDVFGSRLWLLNREKQVSKVLNRAREYTDEALAWLVADGIAKSVSVNASWLRQGVMVIEITINKPDGDALQYNFETLWKAV